MDRYSMIVALTGQLCGTLLIISLIAAFVFHRRSAALPTGTVERLDARLSEMQQSIDAVAVEVERISEGQRFATKLLTERGAGGAEVSALRDAGRSTPVR